MREFKFRVWDKINNKWMHPVWDVTNPFPTNQHHVTEQFIGLTDNNGKDIFESDILVDSVGRNWVVKYNNKMAAFMAHFIDSEGNTNQFQHFKRFTSTQKPLEVIGNIHENPKFIK